MKWQGLKQSNLPLLLRWLNEARDPGLNEAQSGPPDRWAGPFLWSVLYLGSIGTVGTFFGQTWAQRHMTATHAAILFAL